MRSDSAFTPAGINPAKNFNITGAIAAEIITAIKVIKKVSLKNWKTKLLTAAAHGFTDADFFGPLYRLCSG